MTMHWGFKPYKTHKINDVLKAQVFTDEHGHFYAKLDIAEHAVIQAMTTFSEYDAVNDLADHLTDLARRLKDKATEIYQAADND